MDFNDIPVKRLGDKHTYQEFNATIEEIKKKATTTQVESLAEATGVAISELSGRIDKKADSTYVETRLEGKVNKSEYAYDQSIIDQRIKEKANSDLVEVALMGKLDKTTFDAEKVRVNGEIVRIDKRIDTKVEDIVFNTAITDLNTKIGERAKTTDVNAALLLKADKTYVDNGVATLNQSIATKLDKTVFDAEKTRVTQEIVRIDGRIDTKADKTYVDNNFTPILRKILDFQFDKTLTATDNGALLRGSSATDIRIIVPSDSNISIPIGYQVLVKQQGVGRIVVTNDPGVTLQSPDNKVVTNTQFSQFWLIKEAANVWSIDGSMTKDIFYTFYSRVISDGGTLDKDLFVSEFNSQKQLTKDRSIALLIAGANKLGRIYGINPINGNAVSFSFSRSGTATYIDKNGLTQIAAVDIPRIDYDPITKYCNGYLIEGAAINLFSNSANFNADTWARGGVVSVISGDGISPDGLNNATRISLSSGSSSTFIRSARFQVLSVDTYYTASIYVKRGTHNFIGIRIAGTSSHAVFNFDTESFTNIGSSNANRYINPLVQRLNNGWYRISISRLVPVSDTTSAFYFFGISVCNSSGAESYPTNGTENVYIWGLQVEAGMVSTSYIPTLSSQVTRPADSLFSIQEIVSDNKVTSYMNFDVTKSMDGGANASYMLNEKGCDLWRSAGNYFTASYGTVRIDSTITTKEAVTSYGERGLRGAVKGGAGMLLYNGIDDLTSRWTGRYRFGTGPALASMRIKTVALFSEQLSDPEHLTLIS